MNDDKQDDLDEKLQELRKVLAYLVEMTDEDEPGRAEVARMLADVETAIELLVEVDLNSFLDPDGEVSAGDIERIAERASGAASTFPELRQMLYGLLAQARSEGAS